MEMEVTVSFVRGGVVQTSCRAILGLGRSRDLEGAT
jgi:hypothetical protein